MDRKNNIIIIIASVLSGLILLALGVLIGRSLQQPRFFVTEAVGGYSGDQQLLEPGNTLEVQGHGSLPIVPDVAILNIGIEVCNQEGAFQINQNVNKAMATIIEELGKAGLPDDAVAPTSFSMKQYGNDYCGSNKASIYTDDLEQVSDLIDLVIGSGANQIYGVEFTVKEIDIARQEVIELAIKDAQRQAQQTSKLLDQSLGGVISSEVIVHEFLPPYSLDQSGVWLGPLVSSSYSQDVISLQATATLIYEVQ